MLMQYKIKDVEPGDMFHTVDMSPPYDEMERLVRSIVESGDVPFNAWLVSVELTVRVGCIVPKE